MGTHKVYLTEEQWSRVCKGDDEIIAEVVQQQPELGKKLGYELVTTTTNTIAKVATKEQDSEPHKDVASPMSDKSASEAIDHIGNMRSKDRLQDIIDNDHRSTVQEAARKRLAAVENAQ